MSNYVKILEHGTVFSQPDRVTGYAAWPSVTRDADGTLVAAFSGNRIMHVCPYGKVLLVKSRDEGKTWSAPIIAVDTPLDDRDWSPPSTTPGHSRRRMRTGACTARRSGATWCAPICPM